MEHQDLTPEEEVYYANHALIDVCDGTCGDYVAITNYHDGDDFLTWFNGKLYCKTCLKDLCC
jgi:hypothetical protein